MRFLSYVSFLSNVSSMSNVSMVSCMSRVVPVPHVGVGPQKPVEELPRHKRAFAHNGEVMQQETKQTGKKPGEEMDRRIDAAMRGWMIPEALPFLVTWAKMVLVQEAIELGWSKSETLKVARRFKAAIVKSAS